MLMSKHEIALIRLEEKLVERCVLPLVESVASE